MQSQSFRGGAATVLATVLMLVGSVAQPPPARADQIGPEVLEDPVDDPGAPAATTRIALTDHSGEALPPSRQGADALDNVGSPSDADAADSPDVLPEDLLVLTTAFEAPEFVVAGLTWAPGHQLAEGIEVFLRVQELHGWSQWLEVDSVAAHDDGRGGTVPFLTGGASAVQVQISGPVDLLPADLDLLLVPSHPDSTTVTISELSEARQQPSTEPWADPEVYGHDDDEVTASPHLVDESSEAQTQSVPTGASTVRIISRAAWGADESITRWRPRFEDLRAAVVHHTAGTNNYTAAQSAGIVRGIHHFHAVGRDWGDIGYNFLVDRYGQVFEGRVSTVASPHGQMVVGAHAAPYNTNTLGISAMGDFTSATPPQVILDRMREVIAWQFGQAGIHNARSHSGFEAPRVNGAGRPEGQPLPRIFAHRDVGTTTCPGTPLYQRLGSLMDAVSQRVPDLGTGFLDVPSSHAFASSIRWVSSQGITSGYPDGTFRPQALVTRASMAAFLQRYGGSPPPSTRNTFPDVPASHPFAPEIEWLVSRGITTGHGDGTYRPQGNVTRAAVATFLWRLAGQPAVSLPPSSPFRDLTPASSHYRAIVWAASEGITTGYSDGTFRPNDAITRAAAAALLHRFSRGPGLVNGFTDVRHGAPFDIEIAWLTNRGIASGYPNGMFRPQYTVSREAISAFLYRYRGATSVGHGVVFLDVPFGHPFVNEIEWLAGQGIASGYTDGTFRPSQRVSREALAVYLYRLAGEPSVTLPPTSPFSDVSPSSSFYRAIIWLSSTGITTGYSDGTFRPRDTVTRAAAAAMLHRYEHLGD